MTAENGNIMRGGGATAQPSRARAGGGPQPANLGDILERVLDTGIVIAGDIRVNLLDIELLTIKLRLVIASVDTARQLGIDWWQSDPWLSSKGRESERDRELADGRRGRELPEGTSERELPEGTSERELAEENARLRARIAEIEEDGAGRSRADNPSQGRTDSDD